MGGRKGARVKRCKQDCSLPALPAPSFEPKSPPKDTVKSQDEYTATQNSEVCKIYIQDSVIGEIKSQKRCLQGSIGNKFFLTHLTYS